MELDKRLLKEISEFCADPIGRVYEYENKVIRIINKSAVNHVRKIIDCGLLERLMKEKLIVSTKISDELSCQGTIVLEHKKIDVKSSISQWSFEMIKQAALLVLKMNCICMEYGYEIRDGHVDNILFEGTSPIYLDIGSIIKKQENNTTEWRTRNVFLQEYYYPLKLWQRGYVQMIRAKYAAYPVTVDLDEIEWMYYNKLPNQLRNLYKDYRICRESVEKQMQYYTNQINKMDVIDKTRWGTYQTEFWEDVINKRFQHEIEWIKSVGNIKSMVEIGANQGVFAFEVARTTQIEQIIATDYDIQAVNEMYKKLMTKNKEQNNITPLVLDFVKENVESLKKYRSDLVVANALTHHIILAQYMKVHAVMERLDALTNRYVIVEFMPNGVYQGLNLPKWYTLDWFLDAFKRHFNVLSCKKIESNRIVIIGEKR